MAELRGETHLRPAGSSTLMARERWFYSRDNQRMGPMTLQELVEGLLVMPEPLSYLVWNRELSDWTRAGAVPVVESRLSPFVSRPAVDPTMTQPLSVGAVQGMVTSESALPRPPEAVLAPSQTAASAMGGPWLYLAGGAFVVFLAFGVWSMWPRGAQAPDGTPGESPGLTPSAGSSGAPSPDTSGTTRPPGPTQPAGLTESAAVESDLPRSELSKLRGVAGWSGTTLTLTLYNGTSFRVTEVFVRVSRLEGDDFEDSVSLSRLLPPSGDMGAGMAGMMDQVAPDRKKAGVNPLDTGPFEAEVGPQPEAYRWRIEGARGYAFRPGA